MKLARVPFRRQQSRDARSLPISPFRASRRQRYSYSGMRWVRREGDVTGRRSHSFIAAHCTAIRIRGRGNGRPRDAALFSSRRRRMGNQSRARNCRLPACRSDRRRATPVHTGERMGRTWLSTRLRDVAWQCRCKKWPGRANLRQRRAGKSTLAAVLIDRGCA